VPTVLLSGSPAAAAPHSRHTGIHRQPTNGTDIDHYRLGARGSVVFKIYVLIRDAKNVDERVRRLGDEVNSLSHVLGSIKASFHDSGFAQSALNACTGFEVEHWRNVQRSFFDCERTLERFQQLLTKVDMTGGGLFRRPMKLLKLKMNDQEISILEQEIAFFTRAMQLSLNLISVYVIRLFSSVC
jgi:hypothetical protein